MTLLTVDESAPLSAAARGPSRRPASDAVAAATTGPATVLVVDGACVVRELLAAALGTAGYRVHTAADGPAALRLVVREPVDVIITDVEFDGGGSDGFAFLRAIPGGEGGRGRPRPAIILLTARGDRPTVLQAARLPVNGYLLKPKFSLKALLEKIADCHAPPPPPQAPPTTGRTRMGAAQADLPSPFVTPASIISAPGARSASSPAPSTLLTEAATRSRIASSLEGRTLAGVVAQVIAQAGSPRSDVADLAELVQRDALLAARVLHVANSAGYASHMGTVTSVADAVRKIGCAAVRNVAAAVGILDLTADVTAGGSAGADPLAAVRMWAHSFAVARICEQLAPPEIDGGLAYLTGLCCDLGEMLFLGCFGSEYRQVLAAIESTGGRPCDLERTMLGLTRREIESAILERIGLPDRIRRPIRCVHQMSAPARADEPLTALLGLAEHYANGLLLAAGPDAPVAPVTRAACLKATGGDAPEIPHLDAFRGEVQTMTAMLARLPRGDEAALFKPMFPPRDVRLWVARDRGYSPFDPVTAALQMLSASPVAAHERLPTAAELATVDALVVVSRSTRSNQLPPTSLAGQNVPILYLADLIDESSPAQGMEIRRLPVTLRDLDAFLTRVSRKS